MAYVLATTETRVRWYAFDAFQTPSQGNFELLEVLDLDRVPMFSDKETAKCAAIALGLRTWRYVKLK